MTNGAARRRQGADPWLIAGSDLGCWSSCDQSSGAGHQTREHILQIIRSSSNRGQLSGQSVLFSMGGDAFVLMHKHLQHTHTHSHINRHPRLWPHSGSAIDTKNLHCPVGHPGMSAGRGDPLKPICHPIGSNLVAIKMKCFWSCSCFGRRRVDRSLRRTAHTADRFMPGMTQQLACTHPPSLATKP